MNSLPKKVILDSILPLLTYSEASKLLVINKFINDLTFHEGRTVVIKSVHLQKYCENEDFRSSILKKFADPSRQLVLVLNSQQNGSWETKDQFLSSMRSKFPFLDLINEIGFPSLLELKCDYSMFLLICEIFPTLSAQRLTLYENMKSSYDPKEFTFGATTQEYLDNNLVSWIAPHLKLATDRISLKCWPDTASLEMSSSVRSLHLLSCVVTKLSLKSNVKTLHLDQCNLDNLELLEQSLNVLHLSKFRIVDLKKIKPCKRLVIEYAEQSFLNEEELGHYEHLTIKTNKDFCLDKVIWEKTRALRVQSFQSVVNLSLLPNLGQFTDHSSFHPLQLIMNNVIPHNLRFVELGGSAAGVDVACFSNVREIRLIGEVVQSLVGLEKVSRVILDHLSIKSLDGLGCNDYVEIKRCHNVTDFSPLRNVQEIRIEGCHGFNDVTPLSHVPKLSIVDQNIVDVSLLRGVKDLYLKGCKHIDSLVGLDEIPRLIIMDCPQLQKAFKANLDPRIYDRNFGIRAVNNCLTRLPDSILEEIITFLETEEEKLALVHCNCSLYQAFIKRVRLFVVNLAKLGSRLSYFREELLRRVENPYQQLMIDNYSDETLMDCDYRFLRMRRGFSCPRFIGKINHLEIFNAFNYYEESSRAENKGINTEILNFAEEKEVKILTLNFLSGLQGLLPSSMETLHLVRCGFGGSIVAPTQLKELHCVENFPLNLTDFAFLQLIELKETDTPIDVGKLNGVKKIVLDHVMEIEGLSALQDVEDVTVQGCAILDCRNAFSKAKKIKLICKRLAIDLGFYANVEELMVTATKQLRCDNLNLPPKLKKLHLSINKWVELKGFHQLSELKLFGCSNCPSAQGFGSIPNIELDSLPKLKSLEGLGSDNRFVKLIRLPNVTDFSPVGKSKKVIIWECEKFESGKGLMEPSYLVIGKCNGLKDVSMLTNVNHLELIKCGRILSLEGLQGIKELIVKDCDGFDDRNNKNFPPWEMNLTTPFQFSSLTHTGSLLDSTY